ncbi:hypothetical protein SJAV_21440 [Sulfurisphaera javensis]|uniref:Polymerase beta nucleotidyltransferase domain-containing protein n=1 Tax=Sulfurisphaera javensis TaxID=2049879 RepID=A0AAT9GU91_9CREN
MVRLLGYYGSLQRDIDIMIVADDVKEAIAFSSEHLIPLEEIDLHIYTTNQFLELINLDPFLANVYINGKWLIKRLEVSVDKEAIMKKAKRLYEELCREKKKNTRHCLFLFNF